MVLVSYSSVPDPDPVRIWIHWIHIYLGLPNPDPLVKGMDPDPSFILLSSSKNSKKNLDSYCFVTSFGLFIFIFEK
jgi:hypothetical protein